MPYYIIPMPDAQDDRNFIVTVDLSGIDYRLNFHHNHREDFWYYDLLTAEEVPLRTGLKVVSNYPMLRLFVDITKPDGELICVDTYAVTRDPALDDLHYRNPFGQVPS